MSRRMPEAATEIFRVRVSTRWRRTGKEDRTTVDYLGPYYTRSAAQGEATKARQAGWSDTTIRTQIEKASTTWTPASAEEVGTSEGL